LDILLLYDLIVYMSSQLKEEISTVTTDERFISKDYTSTKVNLTDLMNRLKEEKKQEKKSNLLLSLAAVSAVTVFGIILTL
jgi:hypothetical protein